VKRIGFGGFACAVLAVWSLAPAARAADAPRPAHAPAAAVRAPNFLHRLARLTVTSATFARGGSIPVSAEFAPCGGKNVSPQLSWSGAPPETKSFLITLYDPDAPTGVGFWHWTLFDLPAGVTSLAAGAAAHPPAGARQGYTDYGISGYGGPCPPSGDGPHHYRFTIYALDVPTIDGAGAGTTGAGLMFAAQSAALAVGTYTGTFAK
jgi:Raf kinase inhibitor-like YbhB/YbcL family protein